VCCNLQAEYLIF